ncbi:MAG: PDDEXK nuclease domain-containing protein [Mycobacteriaceae bacterium]
MAELKVGQFQPEHLGQLGFCVAWVDDKLRVSDHHATTIGIRLCAGRNDNVVRCSLAGGSAPSAVADYTYDALPASIRDAVPTAAELVTAVDATLAELEDQAAEPVHGD